MAVDSLGEQVFRRRRALGLTTLQLARRLGVHHEMIGLWERGEHASRAKHHPALIAFLEDENWLPDSEFVRFRLRRGWSQERLAEFLEHDARTVGR